LWADKFVQDAQRPELVEGEGAIRKVLEHVVDAVELGVPIGVGGLFPGRGALEGDAAGCEQAAQGFPADPDRPTGRAGQEGSEFADRPAGERLVEFRRAGSGRRHDMVFLVRSQ
jgi:hypothetical protein